MIRPMSRNDLDAVLEIENRSFDAPWDREQFLADVGGEGVRIEVVLEREVGGTPPRIAGYASAWVVAGEMQINTFAVAEQDRRAGLGRRLLTYLLEQADRVGCSDVSLEVSRANLAAIRLYEAAGFRKTGQRKAYYRDSGEDALILTRFL